MTDDAETLGVYCDRLRGAGRLSVKAVLLRHGFDAAFVNGTGQTEMPLPSPAP